MNKKAHKIEKKPAKNGEKFAKISKNAPFWAFFYTRFSTPLHKLFEANNSYLLKPFDSAQGKL